MKTYTIYFEVFDKKMKIDIEAEGAVFAKKELIRRLNEVKIHEIRENKHVDDDDIINFFNNIFNGKV